MTAEKNKKGEKEMKRLKIASLATILGLLLLGSMLLLPVYAVPPVPPYSSLIEATSQGNCPLTVDPAAAYDYASCELIQQVYDTLISFNGERTDSYIPDLATSWTITQVFVPQARARCLIQRTVNVDDVSFPTCVGSFDDFLDHQSFARTTRTINESVDNVDGIRKLSQLILTM
jgi:hypothetical protein